MDSHQPNSHHSWHGMSFSIFWRHSLNPVSIGQLLVVAQILHLDLRASIKKRMWLYWISTILGESPSTTPSLNRSICEICFLGSTLGQSGCISHCSIANCYMLFRTGVKLLLVSSLNSSVYLSVLIALQTPSTRQCSMAPHTPCQETVSMKPTTAPMLSPLA